jgi:hypothetical protein
MQHQRDEIAVTVTANGGNKRMHIMFSSKNGANPTQGISTTVVLVSPGVI